MLPRCSYLHVAAATEVRQYFAQYSVQVEDELWFEHDGRPLKWHYPIGVLFDQCQAVRNHAVAIGRTLGQAPPPPSSAAPSVMLMSPSANALPWAVTVQFLRFPDKMLQRNASSDAVKFVFYHSLRQSLCLQYGDCKRLVDRSKIDQVQLWEGLMKRTYA
jgi:autophagy-related protein 5